MIHFGSVINRTYDRMYDRIYDVCEMAYAPLGLSVPKDKPEPR